MKFEILIKEGTSKNTGKPYVFAVVNDKNGNQIWSTFDRNLINAVKAAMYDEKK